MKMHVYVDGKGEVKATGPAPSEIISKGDGPVFVGFTPARGGDSLTLFEVMVPDNQLLQRNGNIDEFHSRIAGLIRSKQNVRQLDYRKDLQLTEITR